MIKTAFQLGSPAGARAKLTVLIFHRVLSAPDPLFPGEVDAKQFDAICGWLTSWARVMPLQTAVRQLKQGTLPSRAVAITFDDGYADNASVALPLLRKHGLCATFFVSTGYLDGGRMWSDTLIHAVRRADIPRLDVRDFELDGVDFLSLEGWVARNECVTRLIRAIKYLRVDRRDYVVSALANRLKVYDFPSDLMMTSEQVQTLHKEGMQVGAHTVNHLILSQLSREDAIRETEGSRTALERLLDQPVSVFAYPNGKPGVDYSMESIEVIREAGFEVAVTTEWGAAKTDVDPLQVPRFTPWDSQKWRFGWRLVRNLYARPKGVMS